MNDIVADMAKPIGSEFDVCPEALARILVDEVLTMAAAGDLARYWLPRSLQASYKAPECEPALGPMFQTKVVFERRAEWFTENARQTIQTDVGPLGVDLVDRLAKYLRDHPLADPPKPETA